MAMMTHAKFHLMLTFTFGIWASEPSPPSPAWQSTEKAGLKSSYFICDW